MLTPEIELVADERRVAWPECSSCLLHKSIVMRKCCKKSNPRIGLTMLAIKNTNVYCLSPIFILRVSCPNELMVVPFAATKRIEDRVMREDVAEVGQSETCDPVSMRQSFLEIWSVTSPRVAGLGFRCLMTGPAALGDRPASFPTRWQCPPRPGPLPPGIPSRLPRLVGGSDHPISSMRERNVLPRCRT